MNRVSHFTPQLIKAHAKRKKPKRFVRRNKAVVVSSGKLPSSDSDEPVVAMSEAQSSRSSYHSAKTNGTS